MDLDTDSKPVLLGDEKKQFPTAVVKANCRLRALRGWSFRHAKCGAHTVST
jgi:hypothetical protein